MYELVQAGERTFYVNSPAKVGIYRMQDAKVCLIDSGNDKDAGKKILRLCEANGWEAAAVFLTHSHADHMGAGHYIQEKTGCPVYAAGMEQAFVRDPVLEPAFLYGGFPCRELRNKFLMAQPCRVSELREEILPEGLSMLRLPGHSFTMTGFQTSDQVWFLADSLSGEEVLRKHPISFLYDVEAYLDSLERVEALRGRLFVPAHAEAVTEIGPLVRANTAQVREVQDLLKNICREPAGWEDILKKVFERFEIGMDFSQYVLVGSTIRSYLSYLHDKGELEVEFRDNRMLWHVASEWAEWLSRR